jgi:hypothetical protein
MKRTALRFPGTRNNAGIAQMPEQVPQGWRGTMPGEAFTTPVPEKLRDYLLIEVLHSTFPTLKPTTETGYYMDLLFDGPSRIASLRKMLSKNVDVGTKRTET